MIITVSGNFELGLPAERGTVQLTAGAEGANREAVARQASGVTEALRRELVQLRESGAVTWYSVGAQTTSAWHPYNHGAELPLRYRANSSVKVKFGDFAALSARGSQWAETTGLSVDGVEWTLTVATRERVKDEVLAGAVADATHRAGVMAAAAGCGTPQVIAIADPGLLDNVSSGDPGTAFGSPTLMRGVTSGQGDGVVELSPEDITVGSTVEVRFQA
ncbi:SIMPL domain-containing protein [Acidipropionibacterium thoenii]|uniref:SIMPL domain-containing protein n=1 Tax=Acidipropionibacterium thoenii TaxID=1751 RepID=UPI0004093C5F|nr:SIMPL domain-containing protein [Acidipropionibacterium thoenii]